MITFLHLAIILRSSYKHTFEMNLPHVSHHRCPVISVVRAPVRSAGATLVTSISREVARERQAKGKARARARAFPTPLTALPLASTISRGSNRLY